MRNEVACARIGQVRVEDVRIVLGDRFHSSGYVDVVVPVASGAPSAARLTFTLVRQGRALHRVFACPACLGPYRVLHADGAGGFACRWCAKKLTRRQRDRSRVEWSLGGREEDQLVREVARPGRVTEGRMAKLIALRDLLMGSSADLVDDVLERLAISITSADVLIAEAGGAP